MMLSQKQIRIWVSEATELFQRYMPPACAAYPSVHIATAHTYAALRRDLLQQTGCTHLNIEEPCIMEYLHGENAGAILIRQDLLPDEEKNHFFQILWHEMGHFYAIAAETENFQHYADPGLADGSRNYDMSPERLKQEGYWFWQEFIADAISNHVSFLNRSSGPNYQPELIDWHPDFWSGIVDHLMGLLDDAFTFYQFTIDEYALAHYFATLLVQDFTLLYCQAAMDGKLRVQSNETPDGVYPAERIDPTCISDMPEPYQDALWRMHSLLSEKMASDCFWQIDADLLLALGSAISDMMRAKLGILASHTRKNWSKEG